MGIGPIPDSPGGSPGGWLLADLAADSVAVGSESGFENGLEAEGELRFQYQSAYLSQVHVSPIEIGVSSLAVACGPESAQGR